MSDVDPVGHAGEFLNLTRDLERGIYPLAEYLTGVSLLIFASSLIWPPDREFVQGSTMMLCTLLGIWAGGTWFEKRRKQARLDKIRKIYARHFRDIRVSSTGEVSFVPISEEYCRIVLEDWDGEVNLVEEQRPE